ncbi:MAG: Stress response kinase A [Chlamydiae bacterium]|nr:Stress response kinase A [Chlamydiota bacterium]
MKNVDVNHTFPGFSTAFDVPAMKRLIEEALQNENKHLEVTSCEIADVKYEPEARCIFLYVVKLRDASTRKRWKQLFSGFLLKQKETPDATSQKTLFLQEPKIVLYPFPYDPVLTLLPEAYSGDVIKEQMQRSDLFQELNVRQVDISLLAYKPQMRATFLYEITSGDNEVEKQEWIAKTNAFKNPEKVFANYWTLWQESNGKIPMPRPMGFLSHPRVTFQEKIQGTRLGAMVDSESFDEIIKKTATLIGNFHSLQVSLSNTRKLEHEIRTLNRWCALLVHLLPELKQRIESLQTSLIPELERRVNISAPIHADFHHTNLLVEGTEVRLIDLDDIAWGDPCLDIGRFLSSLRIPSLRAFGSFEGLGAMRELFLETYLKVAPQNVRNIRLFEAASLFTSAGSAFRLQRPEWRNDVSMLLNEAEKTFEIAKEKTTLSLT